MGAWIGPGWVASALAAAAFGQPAQQPNWEQIFQDDRIAFAVDRASHRANGGGFTLRTRLEYASVQEDGEKAVVMVTDYRCATRRSIVTHITLFAPDGSEIGAGEIPAAQRREQPAQPTSAEAAVLDRFCR